MGRVAQSIQQRVLKIATEASPLAEAPAEPASTSEPVAAAPPTSGGSEVESAPAGEVPAVEEATGAPSHDLLAEKLAAIRDKRRRDKAEARISERTREAEEKAKAAEEERTRAAEERAQWASRPFKERILAEGGDPRAAFEAMQREAIEAGTPQAEIRRMRAEVEEHFGLKLKPLEETIAALQKQNEELLEERKRAAAEQAHHAFVQDYSEHVKTPDYADLRVEYGDKRLFNLVQGMKNNPGQIRAYARDLNVQLTFPDNRFNMIDILNVLNAAHVAHDTERKQRREQMQAPTSSPGAPQAPANAKTVNGTAERRNAETNPLGNDSAASKASAPGNQMRLGKQARLNRALERNAARRG